MVSLATWVFVEQSRWADSECASAGGGLLLPTPSQQQASRQEPEPEEQYTREPEL